MPTITFTLSDGYPSLTRSKRIGFRARQTFTDGDTIVYPYTLWKTYPHNTEQTVTLLEGQWEVHGLANQSVPFDVPAGGGDLWALIAANLEIPATTPAQRIVSAVESWMSANVNTEVTDTLMTELLGDPDSDAVAAVDARVAAGTAGFLTEAVASENYAPSENIAKAALASAVQTSLTKADEATVAWQPSKAYSSGAVVATPIGILMARVSSGTSASTWASDRATWIPADAGRMWNVKDFGAKGDGTTDDSTAIAAAITAASTNGLPVVFPPGDYRGENFTVPNYVHLVGATAGMTRFASANLTGTGTRRAAVRLYRLTNSSTNPMVVLAGDGSGISNIHLEGTGAPGTILVAQGFETTIRNVRCINSTGIGFDVQKANNTRWSDIYVDNCGSASLPAVKIWSKTGAGSTGETNTLDVYGLTIERQANVALEIGIGADSTQSYAEFVRITKLHIEAPDDNGGGQNADPLVRIGNVRAVTFIDAFIYGGSGYLVSHEYQATRGNPLGGIRFVGGTLLGRTATLGGTPAYLVRLASGNGMMFLGTIFDMCGTAAVNIESGYGNDVFFDSACLFTSRVPTVKVDNRSGFSYYTTRGFQTVEQDLTVSRHQLNNGGALTGVSVSSGTGTPSLQNLTACNDRRGKVFFGSGASPTAGQAVASLTFKAPFASAPLVQVNPSNAAAAAIGPFFASVTTTGFVIYAAGTMAASQGGSTYQCTYIVEG